MIASPTDEFWIVSTEFQLPAWPTSSRLLAPVCTATATGTYPLTAQFPANLKTVPNDRYDISLESPIQGYTNGTTFRLTASPKGSQANDKCGNYTLTNTGLRGANGATSGAIVTECWGK